MTYVGPFNQSTLFYESNEVPPKGQIATPGTILDYVAKKLPYFLEIIKQAGRLSLYNSNQRRYTLFVPNTIPTDFNIDINSAINILKMSTIRGKIMTNMFKNNQILYTMNDKNNLMVNRLNDEILIENRKLLFGDIECENGVIHIINGILVPYW